MTSPTYYIDGLHRQANAPYARRYLGIENDAGEVLLTNFNSSVIMAGYVVNQTPLWNDVRIPMSSLRAGASAPADQPFQPTGVGSLRAYQFRNGFTERLDFELQIPHGLNQSDVYGVRLHVHWACGLSSPSAAVEWRVDASVANILGVFPAPTTYAGMSTPTVAFQHIVTPIHTFTGLLESAVILGNIYRLNGDAYAGNDVFGLSLDAHYVVQQAGSIEEIP